MRRSVPRDREVALTDELPVVLEREGGIAVVRLNRPERLNAVNRPLYRELIRSMSALESDRDLRVLILTGTGRGFCAGADLKAHGAGPLDAEERRAYVGEAQRASRALQMFPRPTIAAVNGHAIGAGLELALCCDFVIVAEEAKLRLPELSLGTFVGGGVTYTLPRRVGLARARELILLCPMVMGSEAAEMGLADRCVPAGSVLGEARGLADRLSKMAPVPTRHAKALLNHGLHADPEALLALEAEALLECMETADWLEGIRAFEEKREPRFEGE